MLPIVVDIPQLAPPARTTALIRRLTARGFEAQTFVNDDGDLVTEVWRVKPPIAARIISRGGRFVSGTLHEPWRFGLDAGRVVTLGSVHGRVLGVTAIAAALDAAAQAVAG